MKGPMIVMSAIMSIMMEIIIMKQSRLLSQVLPAKLATQNC
jgi:hypothetical protein